jgi:hypothetical protein
MDQAMAFEAAQSNPVRIAGHRDLPDFFGPRLA